MAVVNPNQAGCEYPYKQLCGAGVAFKVAQGLLDPQPQMLARDRECGERVLSAEDDVPLLEVEELGRENVRGAADLGGSQEQWFNAGGPPGRTQGGSDGGQGGSRHLVEEHQHIDVALAGTMPAAGQAAVEEQAHQVGAGGTSQVVAETLQRGDDRWRRTESVEGLGDVGHESVS